jgi:integrase
MIVKRGKGYGVSVYDPALKRKRWIGTYPTLRDAREAERNASQRKLASSRITFREFIELWLTDYARPAVATQRNYRYGLEQFKKDFGHLRVADLDRLTARSWAQNHARSNVRAARAMLNDAIDAGLHPGPNPFANLRLEQPRGRKDLIALTEPELHELADCALKVLEEYGPIFRAMILFAGYVGLRPGELFALERGDVGRDEVAIRRNLDGTGRLKLPKNNRERVVILPPPAREALQDVPTRIDVPWLFVTKNGRQFKKSSLIYYWNPVRAAFGRPGMDFYELRHFCATHLLELGVSHADVAVQLGHTDGGALVTSTYGHPSEDAARARIRKAYKTRVSSIKASINEIRLGVRQ